MANFQNELENKKVWKYYGLGAVLLVVYTVLMKPKEKQSKMIWVSYAMLAAVIGILRSINK